MKSIVELIYELKTISEVKFADRFNLLTLDVAYYRRLDFDNWLRRCVEPDRQFSSIDDAWLQYEKSFG
jgi:hypothetical protein